MANICDFSMYVKGNKSDIEKFYNAMTQNGTTWMGRGAEAEIEYDITFDGKDTAMINGWCKWSVMSALVDNAISMRTEPERWHQLNTSYEYITLFEACEKWNLDMEVFSEESGCCFQEHYVCTTDGDYIEEVEEYYEYCISDFETKEEAENELGIVVSDYEWENEDYVSRDGFVWEFTI